MLFHVDNIKIKQKNPVIRYKIANVLTEFTMFKPNKIKKKRNRNSQILLFRYGAPSDVKSEPRAELSISSNVIVSVLSL